MFAQTYHQRKTPTCVLAGAPQITPDNERSVRDVARMDRPGEVGRCRLPGVRRETGRGGGRSSARPAGTLQSTGARFRREAEGVQNRSYPAASFEPSPPSPPSSSRPPRPPRDRNRRRCRRCHRASSHPPARSRNGSQTESLLRHRETHQRSHLTSLRSGTTSATGKPV